MTIRERIELEEIQRLSPFALPSGRSRGRRVAEEESPMRTCFQKDRDRILHSPSFRKLKYKTNVFLSTEGEKFRTRLTHTLEVAQVARSICRALSLNEDLAEAISLGHDLGHTPFGHIGEQVLDELSGHFRHYEQSLRVVDRLEKNGQGLNLTEEVRDGILRHSKGKRGVGDLSRAERPLTLEAEVVRYSDWIAYINHDIDDAIAMGVLRMEDLPREATRLLGERHSLRMDAMVQDLIENSQGRPWISWSPPVAEAVEEVRAYLYEHVYPSEPIARQNEQARAVLIALWNYYSEHYDEVLAVFPWADGEDRNRILADRIAWMTDLEARTVYERISA